VATKVTKNACQQKGFFAATGLCAANQAKPGLQTVALLRSLKPVLLQIFAMPCSRTLPASFCPISPEAALLTGFKMF
jgi:hypothetical protein